MVFTLEKVVPWGRSFDEYRAMFALSDADLTKSILGCGDGPAGFNSILTKQGGKILSVDPIYGFAMSEIKRRIAETYDQIMEQTRRNQHEFVWSHIPSLEDLGRIRMAAMEEFLADYAQGKREDRYVEGELPTLPFETGQFEIAVCSHFLFLYSEQLSLDFHLRSIKELCRIAKEVRIFPILELGSRKSRHVDAVVAELQEDGFELSMVTVPYEFQRGGNQMLRVISPH
jgi:hypothetical protein